MSSTKEAQSIIKIFSPQSAINNYQNELNELGRLTFVVQDAITNARAVRDKYNTVLYIAGGLTGLSETTKQRYAVVSDLISNYPGMFGYAPHLHGTDPIKHPYVTPGEVRDIDYLWAVIVPDYHINFWHPMAHGNAVESGWAEVHNISSIHLVPQEILLSRLVRGMHNIFATVTYDDFDKDGISQLNDLLGNLS